MTKEIFTLHWVTSHCLGLQLSQDLNIKTRSYKTLHITVITIEMQQWVSNIALHSTPRKIFVKMLKVKNKGCQIQGGYILVARHCFFSLFHLFSFLLFFSLSFSLSLSFFLFFFFFFFVLSAYASGISTVLYFTK